MAKFRFGDMVKIMDPDWLGQIGVITATNYDGEDDLYMVTLKDRGGEGAVVTADELVMFRTTELDTALGTLQVYVSGVADYPGFNICLVRSGGREVEPISVEVNAMDSAEPYLEIHQWNLKDPAEYWDGSPETTIWTPEDIDNLLKESAE